MSPIPLPDSVTQKPLKRDDRVAVSVVRTHWIDHLDSFYNFKV